MKIILFVTTLLISSCMLINGVTTLPDDKTKVQITPLEKYEKSGRNIRFELKDDNVVIHHKSPIHETELSIVEHNDKYLIMPILQLNAREGLNFDRHPKVHEEKVNITSIKDVADFKDRLFYVIHASFGFGGGSPGVIKCIKVTLNN